MTVARQWRGSNEVHGPVRIEHAEIPELNRVFSDAFTDRYRRDGMTGVRVPQLNPAIWRYAMGDSGEGALAWKNDEGAMVAFNVVHRSGVEGWMGPLAVRPEWQGSGLGRAIVTTGMDLLKSWKSRVIGLETMPRTMDNIGFYSRQGFVPTHLTITVTTEAASVDGPLTLLGRTPGTARDDLVDACSSLTGAIMRGYDYEREIRLTSELGLGDTVVLERRGRVRGFAVFHSVPLVEGRPREELRVLKLVVESVGDLDEIVRLLGIAARRTGTKRVAIRCQGAYREAYERLVALGARIRWTDLRMTATGYDERVAEKGVLLSNWEI